MALNKLSISHLFVSLIIGILVRDGLKASLVYNEQISTRWLPSVLLLRHPTTLSNLNIVFSKLASLGTHSTSENN